MKYTPKKIAGVQTCRIPQEKSGEETSVNCHRYLGSGIHLHKLFFVLSLTVKKVLTEQHDSDSFRARIYVCKYSN